MSFSKYRNLLFAVITFFSLAALAKAEVEIPKEKQVSNEPPGCCAWACLNTLGNHLGIDATKDLIKQRKEEKGHWEWWTAHWEEEKVLEWNGTARVWQSVTKRKRVEDGWKWFESTDGTDEAVSKKLDSLKVKYKMQDWKSEGFRTRDTSLIKEAIKKNLGCMVTVKPGAMHGTAEGECHAIILVDFTDDKVRILDPNNPGYTYTGTKVWFDHYWDGRIVVLYPPEKK